MDAQTAPSDGGVGASKRASGAAASPSPMDPQAGSPGQATSGGTWGMSLTPGADFSMASPTDSTMAVLQVMMAQQAEMAVMLKGMETRTREAEAARAVAAQGATSSPVKGPVANQGTPARVSFAGGGNGGGTQSGGAQGGGGGGPRRS